jgi:hypothetical protein
VPQAYTPPYARPGGDVPAAYAAPPAPRRHGSALGVVALVAGIIAGVVVPVVGAIAAWWIGFGAGAQLPLLTPEAGFSWAVLTPVRDWVLLGEVSFWVGSALGIWALSQGIVAIAKARGRVAGIVAVILACLGPIFFAIGVQVGLSAGFAASGLGG